MTIPIATTEFKNDTLYIKGDVTLANVTSLVQTVKHNIDKIKTIDCSNLNNADSSFLALLLWIQSENKIDKINITHITSTMITLHKLYDLEKIIELPTKSKNNCETSIKPSIQSKGVSKD